MTHHHDARPTRTVLIVDDEYRIRDMLRSAVLALGYDAEVAASGQEALDHLARRSYDAVICDLLMPNMTGDELFRICREEQPEVASRFVFLSGHYGDLPSTDVAAASGQPYLKKPCRLAEIGAAIDRIAPPVTVA